MTDIDAIIPYLPSVLNNKHLNNSDYKTLYSSDGKCDTLIDELEKYEEIREFCLYLTGILSKFNTKRPFWGLFQNHNCIIVKYWMFDNLYNGTIQNNRIHEILGKLIKIWDEYDAKNCDFIKDVSTKDNFEKMKKLYYYASNYETIQMYINDKQGKCHPKVRKYIDEMDKLYNEVKDDCKNPISIYCNILNDINSVYTTKDKLSKLNCIEESLTELPTRSDVNVGGFQARTNSDGGFMSYGTFNHSGEDSEDFSLGPEASRDSISPSNTIMASTIPVLGILVAFFTVYKFTPLGTMLHSRLLRNKITRLHAGDEEPNIYVEDFYEYDESSYSGKQNNIRYLPLQNN
ncbi:PIR Superfamily Protein [Plasmodium ovale wallikeri]|uniref:PIR Superfamily Protein n=1 Tax=Plasmodium ovale wallikeri TaxID=864142 RepID=A0A1A9AK50_PLAOA|nr:PIR Superfamily Protein [Plasmodium ovale wallikeri]SBT58118.1 PIR Superfamily Protein [Plasmodium ovale wallikeri]